MSLLQGMRILSAPSYSHPMLILLLSACNPVCGDIQLTTAADGAELFDIDGDGLTDLTEACGTLSGAYGNRRPDLGWTQIILSADADQSGEIRFDTTTYVLGVAEVWFLTEHLQIGEVMTLDNLAGSGLHKPHGTAGTGYTVFELSAAEIEVLDQRKSDRVVRDLYEEDNPLDYLLRWDVQYGEGAQSWNGHDWVQVMDTSDRLEPAFRPPDAP